MKFRKIAALFLSSMSFLLSSHVQAQYSYSKLGTVTVSENIANPKFPTHVVTIFAQRKSGRVSNMEIRCDNNKTEVYISMNGIYGNRGETRIKWPSMSSARYYPSSNSTDGRASFLSSPISFVQKLISEKSVIADIDGYSVRGAAEFQVDEYLIDAIYALAKTCQWDNQLPKIDKKETDLPSAGESSEEKSPAADVELSECVKLIQKFDRRKKEIDRININRPEYWKGLMELFNLEQSRKEACGK